MINARRTPALMLPPPKPNAITKHDQTDLVNMRHAKTSPPPPLPRRIGGEGGGKPTQMADLFGGLLLPSKPNEGASGIETSREP